MTRWEMLEALTDAGQDSASFLHDGLEGWFGWSVHFANGDAVLKVGFEDIETGEVTEFEWVLNPREAK